MSTATSEGDEGPHKQPKKPRRGLEQVQGHLQQADETDSPKSGPRDPDKLGHNVGYQALTRRSRNAPHVTGTSASMRQS